MWFSCFFILGSMDEASKEKISMNESFENAFLKAELKIEKKRQKWLQKKAKISGAPAASSS